MESVWGSVQSAGTSMLSSIMDIEYLSWLLWLFKPVMIAFLLPFMIFFLIYLSILFLYVYRFRYRLRYDLSHDVWKGARTVLAIMWWGHAKFWHGYEVVGLENIPEEGGALLIYYHGAIPIDYYYLVAGCIIYRDRLLTGVGDRFLLKLPGFKLLMDVMRVSPGSVSSCAQQLSEGNLLAIAPGGVYEALFGDHTYRLLWRERIGFAKVAIAAQVPIIPVFTMNLREAFRSFTFPKAWFERLYEWSRLPLVPIYGGFPVKLKTFIGSPIPYDPDLTPRELAMKTVRAMEGLIERHQRIPGSILRGLGERVIERPKCR